MIAVAGLTGNTVEFLLAWCETSFLNGFHKRCIVQQDYAKVEFMISEKLIAFTNINEGFQTNE